MQHVQGGRSTRPTRAPRERPAVAVRYSCPLCGGDHRRDEHGLRRLAEFRQLSPHELRELRLQALEELAAAVRGGAGREHVEQVSALLTAVDARLERLEGLSASAQRCAGPRAP